MTPEELRRALAADRQANTYGVDTTSSADSFVTPQRAEWKVYLGNKTGQAQLTPLGATFRAGAGDTITSDHIPNVVRTDDAMMQFNTWSDKRRADWLKLLHDKGLVDPADNTWDSAEKWWQTAVVKAGNMYAGGKKTVTPEMWTALYAGGGPNGNGSAGGSDSRYAPAGTTVNRNKTIPYEDPAAVRAMIKDGVHSLLGRRVDDSELDDMMHVARQYEAANPSVTQATVTNDGKGNTSTVNKTVDPGTSAEGYKANVEDAMKAKPEYASYQAASTYMNWLMGAVSAPVQDGA